MRSFLKRVKTPEPKPVEVDYLAECEKSLSRRLGRGVKIVSGKRKGKLNWNITGRRICSGSMRR